MDRKIYARIAQIGLKSINGKEYNHFTQKHRKFILKAILTFRIKCESIVTDLLDEVYKNISLEHENINTIIKNTRVIKIVLKEELKLLVYKSISYSLENASNISIIGKFRKVICSVLNILLGRPKLSIETTEMIINSIEQRIRVIIEEEVEKVVDVEDILTRIRNHQMRIEKVKKKEIEGEKNGQKKGRRIDAYNLYERIFIHQEAIQDFRKLVEHLNEINKVFSDVYLEQYVYLGFRICQEVSKLEG